MINLESANSSYRRDLGDGLILRWSTSDDTEGIAQLVGLVFRDREDEPLNTPLEHLMRELMSGTHPVMGAGDFALVEDTRKQGNSLVACTCLWRHTWEYEGIPFKIGRPEIVATDPGYRNRRLIRAVFEVIHARSEAEGHLVQAITGIPYFYRLFGYEYALDLGGRCSVYIPLIPQAKEDAPEPFSLRDASWEDIPLVQQLYDQQRASGVVSALIDEAWWRYQITSGRAALSGEGWHIQMIVDSAGQSQGYVITPPTRWQDSLRVIDLAFASGANVQAIMPSLLRSLAGQGAQLPMRESGAYPFSRIAFNLGRSHPVYDVLEKSMPTRQEAPYAWYVRVAHLPNFMQLIAPVLERRLASSVVAGYSGELRFDFYRGGLRMFFERGRLRTVEDWRSPIWNANEDGGFPPLVFLQLLFGYRSLDALRSAFPDVWVNENVELLVNTLFPYRPSRVLSLG
ncbi:MAG TPA: GNAT family N-acetyltransferase [Ktedonobacteraceae bacterium]